MTVHDFIFSNQTRHRISRHACFWFICWMYFVSSYYLPGIQFKGWKFNQENILIAQYGLAFFIFKVLFINTLPAVVFPLALYTNCIIFFALPRLLSDRYKTWTTLLIFTLLMAIIYGISMACMYIPQYNNNHLKLMQGYASLKELIPYINRTYLFNLPVVAGFAITIKLAKIWILKQAETESIAKEKANAELQLLKAQIQPHFLFNTLNNIYYYILSNSAKAPEMIKKLIALLNFVLNECNQATVPLNYELKFIQDYIALEKIRYGDRLTIYLDLPDTAPGIQIAPLLLIPFIENSFKHGASKMISAAWISVKITATNDELSLIISNSVFASPLHAGGKVGIGIINARKRLNLLYPEACKLQIYTDHDRFTIHLKINTTNGLA